MPESTEPTLRDLFRLLTGMRAEARDFAKRVDQRFTTLDQNILSLRSDNLALHRAFADLHQEVAMLRQAVQRLDRQGELIEAFPEEQS